MNASIQNLNLLDLYTELTISGDLQNSNQLRISDQSIVSVLGDYSQDSQSRLIFHVGGSVAGAGYGQLLVSQSVMLDGEMALSQTGNQLPGDGQTLQLIQANSITGTFAEVQGRHLVPARYSRKSLPPHRCCCMRHSCLT